MAPRPARAPVLPLGRTARPARRLWATHARFHDPIGMMVCDATSRGNCRAARWRKADDSMRLGPLG